MRSLRSALGGILLIVGASAACGGDDAGNLSGGDGGGPDATAGVDGGAPGTDSGTPGTDSGMPGRDSGTPGKDGGTDAAPPPPSNSVVQHHNHANRDGSYVQPGLTKAAAATMALDASFAGKLTGNVYTQPLYVENGPAGKGTFYVATENDTVFALDETTGNVVWQKPVATGAGGTGICGNIQPLGITGTPTIDLQRRTIYFDTAVATTPGGNLARHEIHALSIDDGSERAGWPVDVSKVKAGNLAFDSQVQNQRSAVLEVGDHVYVAYGGHAGDCADPNGVYYHGWVVSVPVDNPAGVTAYATQAEGAGIWAPGGPSSDGTSVFAATGNMMSGSGFAFQDAIVRLGTGATFSGQTADYFAPTNWQDLDNGDVDIAGSGPIPVDLKGAGAPQAVVLAFGKDGKVYVIDRTNMGGIHAALATSHVVNGEIINATATYPSGSSVYAYLYGNDNAGGSSCPNGQSGNLVAVKITAGNPPTIATAWCADGQGLGSPIVTTTDGTNDALVWSAGAEGSGKLHAWDALTGQLVFDGGPDSMQGLRHMMTIIAVKGRIFAAGDDQLYAFKHN